MYDGEPAGAEPLRFSTAIDLREFAWLSLRNGLLNLVTLTLYRFWGKTLVRRRVWDGVRLNDEPLEYTGRGMELFIGFLLATLVVGAPFLILVFAVQFLHPLAAAPLIGIIYIGLFFLVGFGTFTAFRYAASRTRWRGVRFRLRGDAKAYGFYFLLMVFARGFSLGWATPAADMFLAERLWGGLGFGDKPFRWSRARVVNLYGRFAVGWCSVFLAYVAFIGGIIAMAVAGIAGDAEAPPAELLIAIYAVTLVLVVVVAAAFIPYNAGLMREIAASLTLDEARFRLNVRSTALLGLGVTNILLLLVTLGLAAPFVQARTTRFIIDRLSAEGSARLAETQQTVATGPAHGEGLADAFGLSPI